MAKIRKKHSYLTVFYGKMVGGLSGTGHATQSITVPTAGGGQHGIN